MNQDLFSALEGSPDRLTLASWPPQIQDLKAPWQGVVEGFFKSPSGVALVQAIRQRLLEGTQIYPPRPLRLLEELAPEDVRVVILGQDPYHGLHQAEGLSFSVARGVKSPPSLVNIFKELERDLGVVRPKPTEGSLMPWVRQGVFLLNQTLSVEAQLPASHAHLSWSILTQSLLREIVFSPGPCAFLLWGMHAQKNLPLIEAWSQESQKEMLILSSNHPSPLSALKGEHPFIGCGHFGLSQRWLASRGVDLDWRLA